MRGDAIVEAAMDIAEDKGIDGVTTAALAGRLEFTEAALYRYFKSKEDIIAAAATHLAERILATMTVELTPADAEGYEPESELRRHIKRFTVRSGLFLDFLIHAAGTRHGALCRVGHNFFEEYTNRLFVYFQELQKRKLIKSKVSPEELARLWTCQLTGGFVRARLAGDKWNPLDHPGYIAFVKGLNHNHSA